MLAEIMTHRHFLKTIHFPMPMAGFIIFSALGQVKFRALGGEIFEKEREALNEFRFLLFKFLQ